MIYSSLSLFDITRVVSVGEVNMGHPFRYWTFISVVDPINFFQSGKLASELDVNQLSLIAALYEDFYLTHLFIHNADIFNSPFFPLALFPLFCTSFCTASCLRLMQLKVQTLSPVLPLHCWKHIWTITNFLLFVLTLNKYVRLTACEQSYLKLSL